MALSDGVISIDDTRLDELEAIRAMESHEEAADYVTVFPVERHRRDLGDSNIVYKSIYGEDGSLIGFLILVLDPDGCSVELRRIVVAPKDRGYGRRAMALLDRVCRDEIGRRRVWLDVFEFNTRGQRVYERSGYRQFGTAELDGKPLRLYEKTL